MNIYKYVSPTLLNRTLTDDGEVCLKFEFPKNYNDPLELFLTLRGHEDDPRVIAYYKEILGDIPQLPTTCFSKRPDVIPMWAHYGDEHAGFALEFNEEALCENISIGYLEDIEYVDEAGAADWGLIRHAAYTLKPRHTYFAQTDAFSKAYFTKNRCWEYEMERRLVVDPKHFPNDCELMLLKVPSECLSAIIVGVRTTDDDRMKLRDAAKQCDCAYYEMRIGRSSCTPHFADEAENSLLFVKSKIEEAAHVCADCSEPLADCGSNCCQWCTIGEADVEQARRDNPFRMLDHLGLRNEDVYGFSFMGMKPIGKLTKDGA